jgi:hypothetical protein
VHKPIQSGISRTGGKDPSAISIPEDFKTLARGCESSLRVAVDHYREAAIGTLPPHARAMIKRQYVEMQQAYDEVVAFCKAA